MPDGLITPGLVLQVAEAAKDYRITPTEFSEIMGTICSIFLGAAVAGCTGMLIGAVTKRFTEETATETSLKGSNPEEETWLERLGDCYRWALRFIIKEDEGWLIHGRIFAGTPRHWMEHAWVELPTGYIYEPVADTLYKKDTFYQAYKAQELKRYTPTEAAKLAARFGHYGPWY